MRSFIIGMSLLALACAPGDQPTSNAGEDGELPAVANRPSESPTTEIQRSSDTDPAFTIGQTLYAPVYSHVYFGPDKRQFNLACTLSVRNIDTRSSITLTAVDYHDTVGNLVRPFLDRPTVLAPLETVDFYIQERDTTGGSGANFIVRWGSTVAVDAPIVEAVMIGVADGQGISFVSPAREITD